MGGEEAIIAGENGIVFMTVRANPLVILEAGHILPGPYHSAPRRSEPDTSPRLHRLVTAFPGGLHSVVKNLLFGNNRAPIWHFPCKGPGESPNRPPCPALLPGTAADAVLRQLREVTSSTGADRRTAQRI